MRGSSVSRIEAVGLEHVVQRPVSFHQPLHDVRLDAPAAVDEVLDRVGDLELAARRTARSPRAASWISGVNM